MIGSRTGKWYYFDGTDWIQSDPPSIQEGKAICIYCGFENTLKSVLCARCGQNLAEKAYFCKKCGHEMLAIDVAVIDDGIVCPQCHGRVEEKDAN